MDDDQFPLLSDPYKLGTTFSLQSFLRVVQLKEGIEQGLPDCTNLNCIEGKTDGFYQYFKEFDKYIRSNQDQGLYSLDAFDPVIKNLRNKLSEAGGEFNPNTIQYTEEYKKLIQCINKIFEEYLDTIGTYIVDLSANPFPVHQYQLTSLLPAWQVGVLPKAVVADWNEALGCLLVQKYSAGCMMAYRAAETMLKYFYKNITGEDPISKTKHSTSKEKNKAKIEAQEMTWDSLVNQLTSKNYLGSKEEDDLAHALDRARIKRNKFAHGSYQNRTILTHETSAEFIDFASHVIIQSVKKLVAKKKTWRILVEAPSLECAATHVLLNTFAGGITFYTMEGSDTKDSSFVQDWPYYYLRSDAAIFISMYDSLVTSGYIPKMKDLTSLQYLLSLVQHTNEGKDPLVEFIKKKYRGNPRKKSDFVYGKLIEACRLIMEKRLEITNENILLLQKELFPSP